MGFLCVVFYVAALMKNVVIPSKTSVSFYQSARCNFIEDESSRSNILCRTWFTNSLTVCYSFRVREIVSNSWSTMVSVIAVVIGPVCWCERGCMCRHTRVTWLWELKDVWRPSRHGQLLMPHEEPEVSEPECGGLAGVPGHSPAYRQLFTIVCAWTSIWLLDPFSMLWLDFYVELHRRLFLNWVMPII